MLGVALNFLSGALFAIGINRNKLMNQQVELTASEHQLLELLRETHVDGFRLVIELNGGAWEVTVSGQLLGKPLKSLGSGASFGEAWDNMAPWGT
jgi:hypothetical protein